MEEKHRLQEQHLDTLVEAWDPAQNPKLKGDPFKTLFVSRLDYETNEEFLNQTFSRYGPIKTVSLVRHALTGTPRGYAFIEFEHERDMRAAFKDADGMKLQGRRIVVDCERGRTVKSWKPRRFGGGLGGTRLGGVHENVTSSGRVNFGNFKEKQIYDRKHGLSDGRDKLLGTHQDQDGQKGSYSDSHRDASSRQDYRDRQDYREHDGDRGRDRTRDRDQDRDRDRDKDRDRDRDKGRDREYRGRDGDQGREYESRRERGQNIGCDRERDRDRNRDRDHGRHRERDRDKEKERTRSSSHRHERAHSYKDRDEPFPKKPRVSASVEDGELV
jgi:U1 small nuclear ribonucleoprotein 70kDa